MSCEVYFDEDSAQHRLVGALRSHHLDVVTSLELGMNAQDEKAHLTLASAQGRVLVSSNVCDFALLHGLWIKQERSHCGVLIIPQQRYSTGEIVRRMLRVASSGFDLTNGLFYLSNF